MKFCKVGLFLALLVVVCLPVVAQTQMRLDIPFSFIAAGKSLPAGHYRVERVFDDGLAWRVYSEHASVVMLTNSVQSRNTAHRPSLVFLRAGASYSLIQIWPEGHFGRDVLRSNVKRTLVAESGNYLEIAAK